MKLRIKVLLVIALTLLGLMAVLYATASRFVESNLNMMETTLMAEDTHRVITILNDRLDNLDRSARDWAHWDDAYQYVVGESPGFEQSNLTDSTFSTLGLNLIIFLGPDGEAIFSSAYDLDEDVRYQVPEDEYQQLAVLCKPARGLGIFCNARGLIRSSNRTMLVATRAILDSQGEGPAHGTLIFGRYLDKEEIKKLAQLADLDIDLYLKADPNLPADVADALPNLTSYQDVYVNALPSEKVAGYTLLPDLYSYSGFVLRAQAERSMYKIGQTSLRALVIALIVITLAFSIVTLLLIERLVLSRVARLHEYLSEVGRSGNLRSSLQMGSSDELSALGGSLNRMLEDLDHAQIAVRENEARYRAIVEDQTELICRILPDGTLTFVNEAYCRYYGLLRENLVGQAFIPRIPEEDLPQVAEKFAELSYHHPVITYQHRVRLPNGETRWQQWTERAIYDENKQLQEYQLVGRDTTATKQIEEKLRYLGLHDPLTGLHNRAYMEAELDRIDREQMFPTTIIVADMDGLKAINDQLGHLTGDQVLIETAQILAACFRPKDIVVRTGGDEFAVILPNTSQQAAENLVTSLRAVLDQRNAQQPDLPIELSIGMNTAQTSDLLEARKQADQAMYREKRNRRSDGRMSARFHSHRPASTGTDQ